LPHGAVVTQVDFYVHDGDASYEVSGTMYYNLLGNSVVTTMATTTGSGVASTAGAATLTATSVGDATIDNSNRSYYLRYNTYQSNSNLRVYGAKITYTVTKAD
jgi:hypothetical protein